MFKSIDDYVNTLEGPLHAWTISVIDYLKKNYAHYELVLSYQRPMIKIKPKLFIMLGGGKNHFSLYTTDFEYVESYKLRKIPKIKFGKSAILFPLEKPDYMSLAYQVCDEVIQRNR
ncbi:MAG: hypothetical protein A2Y45_06610 [Tenericutes bacterium GWC2_34_14]|nr:MAG: hypothetical protein A2Z84_04310 [Tenericutes bacterium GWA2_35_7]OHE28620.1 MAG: hypothetical protein A2Y45_06610 [Tenericutes bacterium GWC2_34_14]OHE33472.1 MAG: hypothetical protein A2012_03200 [Tenericutes bacterium GWE2_34_108]OHE36757.1 MAG: hypothetical protein A2Y46_09000 [Tenericutes bacterium GWF1_35_14]OHE38163.1 MAG: hypothetical protein A2Y44_09665 [Tenericutes bacterium GWF2_35_184]OHE43319.1 MAG: hypothetical protein A2221_06070 [Tenericutes bacterium RIFOXYA2_FULL_36_3